MEQVLGNVSVAILALIDSQASSPQSLQLLSHFDTVSETRLGVNRN